MKIWLDQGCAYGNLGDEAMLLTAIRHLKKCFSNCEFIIPAHPAKPLPDIGNYQRIEPPQEMFRIINVALRRRRWLKYLSAPLLSENWDAYLSLFFIDRLFRNIPDIKPIYQSLLGALDTCDMYYAVGAANLHDWSINESILPRLWVVEQFKKRNKPIVISSQTIGPLKKRFTKYAVRQMIQKSDITTLRDPQVSLDWLKKIGIKASNSQVIGDEAFSLEPAPTKFVENYLRQNGIDSSKPYTLFHVRHTTYRGHIDAQNTNLHKTLNHLACHHQVLLCPMSYGEHSGLDVDFLGQIKTGCNRRQVKVGATITTPQMARGLVEHCHHVVALSYHLQVFAIAAKKPFICLVSGDYYKHKAKAILDWLNPEFRFQIDLDNPSSNPTEVCNQLLSTYSKFTNHLNDIHLDISQRQNSFHSQLSMFSKDDTN